MNSLEAAYINDPPCGGQAAILQAGLLPRVRPGRPILRLLFVTILSARAPWMTGPARPHDYRAGIGFPGKSGVL